MDPQSLQPLGACGSPVHDVRGLDHRIDFPAYDLLEHETQKTYQVGTVQRDQNMRAGVPLSREMDNTTSTELTSNQDHCLTARRAYDTLGWVGFNPRTIHLYSDP